MANPFDSTNLQNVSVRPLTAGMFQNLPSNGLPQGAFWRIQNFRVKESGLLKRGGLIDFDLNLGTGENLYDEKLYDIIYFYNRDPSVGAEQLLLSATKLYRMDGAGNNVVQDYENLNALVSTNTATSGDKFTIDVPMTQEQYDRIRPDDYLTLDGISYQIFTTTGYAGSIGTISLYGLGVLIGDFVGQTCNIYERFISESGLGPQYAVLPSVGASTDDKVIVCDQGERGLYQYTTSGGLEPYVIDSTDGVDPTEYVVGGKTITYFDDRLWLGNTEEIDGQFRQRIRWSDAVNFDRIAPASYTDLPYSEGQLLRLVPLGSLLVAYYEDAIYIGRRTNMAGQPYFFERVESGNVGLLNARAVVRHTDTHYFVGEDNIYRLSGSGGFEQIGSPILDEAFYYTKGLELLKEIQAEHDPITESIVFLFPDKLEVAAEQYSSIATRLWRFYYKTGAWAYDEVSFSDSDKTVYDYIYSGLLPSNTYVYGESWEDWEAKLTDAAWVANPDPPDPTALPGEPNESFEEWQTWSNLSNDKFIGTTLKIGVVSAPLNRQLIVEEFVDADQDTIGSIDYPVWVVLESGDHDIGLPDYTKTVTRLSIKTMHIYSERESSLMSVGGVFTLNISDAMGYHWKRPVTFRFKSNYNEGYANFRSTGSTFRYKLVGSQVIAPYRISEYVMRIVGRGLQVEN